MRALPVAAIALATAACDCAASHERGERDGATDAVAPADAGAAIDSGTDPDACWEVARIALGGSRTHGIAVASDRVAVTMSDRVAIVADGGHEPRHVLLPTALSDADGHGALIAPDLDGFLIAHAATTVRMALDGALGPLTTLPVDNPLPRVVDLEGRLDGDLFAALIWDARPGGSEDLPAVGRTKLFLLDATGAPTQPAIVVNGDERTLPPVAIGEQIDVWWYAEEGWDDVGERPFVSIQDYTLDGDAGGSWGHPLGNEAPEGGDPLDRWTLERFDSATYSLAWVNRSRIFGHPTEEALHVALAASSAQELTRAPAIASFSVGEIFNAIVVAWTAGDATVHIDGIGDPVARGTLDLGPGAVRTLHLVGTSRRYADESRALALAYELVTPAGSVEAWLAWIACP